MKIILTHNKTLITKQQIRTMCFTVNKARFHRQRKAKIKFQRQTKSEKVSIDTKIPVINEN